MHAPGGSTLPSAAPRSRTATASQPLQFQFSRPWKLPGRLARRRTDSRPTSHRGAQARGTPRLISGALGLNSARASARSPPPPCRATAAATSGKPAAQLPLEVPPPPPPPLPWPYTRQPAPAACPSPDLSGAYAPEKLQPCAAGEPAGPPPADRWGMHGARRTYAAHALLRHTPHPTLLQHNFKALPCPPAAPPAFPAVPVKPCSSAAFPLPSCRSSRRYGQLALSGPRCSRLQAAGRGHTPLQQRQPQPQRQQQQHGL